MLLQNTSMNLWNRNLHQWKPKRNSKRQSLPRPLCMPALNDPSITGETKSQSSRISIKITNARDADNVVIEWYRHYRNNKPFEYYSNEQLLTMAKRQSAGGGCRSIEIKRSYPCLKCKELNKTCDCAKFRNIYRKIYGPTTDETILVGMETLHSLVSSHCSDSQISMNAAMGTDRQQEDGTLERIAPRNSKPANNPERKNNYARDNDRYGNEGRGKHTDDYDSRERDRDNRRGDKYGANSRNDQWYQATSDEANIEIQDIHKSQSQNRRQSEEDRRGVRRKSSYKGNGNARNSNSNRGSRDNSGNVKQEFNGRPIKQEKLDDDPEPDTPSMYSNLNADTRVLCKPSNCAKLFNKPELTHSFAHTPLYISNQTDNGARQQNGIDNNIEQIASRQNHCKISQPDTETNSNLCVNKCVTFCPPLNDEPENDQNKDLEEKSSSSSEETDSQEYIASTPQLYPCILGSMNYDQSTSLMSQYVVPYWDREKSYPTVHFISSIPQIARACAGADSHKSCSGSFKKTLDLVEYLLRPFPHMLNVVDNSDTDSLLGSRSHSSLTVSCTSSIHSAPYGITKIMNQTEFGCTEDDSHSICHVESEKNALVYDTGQTYLPTTEPELMFPEHKHIDVVVPVNRKDILCFPFQFGKKQTKTKSTNSGSESPPVESITVENTNTTTYSSTEESDSTIDTTDLIQHSNAMIHKETNEINENKKEQVSLSDVPKSYCNKSTQLNKVDELILEDNSVHSSSLQDSNITKTKPRIICPDPATVHIDNTILRELNVIAHDRSARQVLTPIQEVSEISQTDLSCTETECDAKSAEGTTNLKLSAGHDNVEKDKGTDIDIEPAQSKLSTEHSRTASDTTSESMKEGNDISERIDDSNRSSLQLQSQSVEIITSKPTTNLFQYDSSAYSPILTTCSCFSASQKESDEDSTTATQHGGKRLLKDKQINTSPVRIMRVSRSQQTDPVKLRPIKKKGDKVTELATETSAATTSVSTDTVSVLSSKRKSSKSKRRSTTSNSIIFERKSSKGNTVGSEEASSLSVTPTAIESKEDMSDTRNIGDRPISEQRVNRNLSAQETRYAIARITTYDEFTTYEILKSTRAKPRIIPQTTEGVFTVRNRKKRKLKL